MDFFGVLDYAAQKDQRTSRTSDNNALSYYFDGRKFPENEQEGDGFKQGDIVPTPFSTSSMESTKQLKSRKLWEMKVEYSCHMWICTTSTQWSGYAID